MQKELKEAWLGSRQLFGAHWRSEIHVQARREEKELKTEIINLEVVPLGILEGGGQEYEILEKS